MAKIWVLVSDENRARMFLTDRSSSLIEQEDYTAAAVAGEREKKRNTDRLEHARPAMEGGRDPRAEDERRFARSVADRLREARLAGKYERLFVVAPPAFLGALRHSLDTGTRGAIVGELPKNLSRLKAGDIRSHMPELL